MRVDESVSGVRITTEAAPLFAPLSRTLFCVLVFFLHAWSNGEGATKERVFSSSAPLFRFFFPQ
jgi:hypothetical protein